MVAAKGQSSPRRCRDCGCSHEAVIEQTALAWFQAATATMTGSRRLEVFYSLPRDMQEQAWRELRHATEREREGAE